VDQFLTAAEELGKAGLWVSHTTVARLLEQLDYRLRVNHKKLAGKSHPQRNTQFEYIATQRRRCAQRAIPLISIDTKKKEVVGSFKNAGVAWSRHPRAVCDHDFRREGVGMAIPYGIYDVRANRGSVFIGKSHDTADFALDSIAAWWRTEGKTRYPNASQLFILTDNGGSNGSTHHAWRYALQRKLANPFGLKLTVCHYPPATSKWNPVEHRLFAQISRNWAGEPLISYETIVNFIRKTTTETGLQVIGQSGASAADGEGFQQLVTEVGMGRAVAGGTSYCTSVGSSRRTALVRTSPGTRNNADVRSCRA